DLTWEAVLRLCRSGVLVGRVGLYGNVIRIAPPLVITEEQAEEALGIFSKVLRGL
ncbi:MAG: 4-aminobutyrate--2-oxoglutarate transaminase, partial [Candidatus Latescibacterota bacterium]